MVARTFLFLSLVSTAGCAPLGPWPKPSELQGLPLLPLEERHSVGVEEIAPTAIGYSGEITEEGLAKVHALTRPETRTVFIRSQGGDVEPGMRFGDWIRENEIDVVVVDYCISSCANYVFVSAVHKTILPGAIVAWHGNMRQSGFENANWPPGRYEALVAEEDGFFARAGVSECLCRLFDAGLTARGLYSMTAEDMGLFGVTNVRGGPAGPEEMNPSLRRWLRLSFVRVPKGHEASACR
jgi:hypothetical protein